VRKPAVSTVLLVDDSAVARRAVARRLEAEGFDVQEESSAARAVRVDASTLACAIIDLELADGDGSQVAAALLGKRAFLPVAFFTAGASPTLLEHAGAHGPVFRKPDVDSIVAWAKRVASPSTR
jgi:CheY-like chemotaxis protein